MSSIDLCLDKKKKKERKKEKKKTNKQTDTEIDRRGNACFHSELWMDFFKLAVMRSSLKSAVLYWYE